MIRLVFESASVCHVFFLKKDDVQWGEALIQILMNIKMRNNDGKSVVPDMCAYGDQSCLRKVTFSSTVLGRS